MPQNLLKDLNEEQNKAVTFGNGPLLIVAGAGTGKTTVITRRLAWLIEKKLAKSDEILALTFTEKAATEMEERVDKLLPYGYLDLWVSTFHSFAERILKNEGLEIGLPNDFKLLDTTEQWLIVRQNLDKFNLDYFKPLGNPTKFIHALIKLFSRAKDEAITPQDYLNYAQNLKLNTDSSDFVKSLVDQDLKKTLSKKELKELVTSEIKKVQEIAEAYHTYQQLLLDNNALDFGDLINYCLILFKTRPLILNKYRQQFKYILVDEFQDTNYAQYELIKILAVPKNNLTVVADDDQCLPPDTLIAVRGGQKMIKDIKVGDKVTTAVGRGYLSYSRVNRVFKNKKKTKFITLKTVGGYQIKVTDNHKMFCLVPAIDDKKYYYVYLMHRQKFGWRLGVTNDLAVRLRLERSADRIIGIKTCFSEEEARFYEAFYSLKYNIPTVCFKERDGVMIRGQWLNKLFEIIDTEGNARRLAKDLNLDLRCHHYSLGAVNRGQKVRIKINLEMCQRRYKSKYAKNNSLSNPLVLHTLILETSDKLTIKKLKSAGYQLKKAKNGYCLRISHTDLKKLGKIALELERITGGILESYFKLGRTYIQTKKALVMPARNILVGQYLPIVTKKGIIYNRVIKRIVSNEETATVYDLEVERTHNFVANSIIVHNSIFKFRGASVSNILGFKKDYPKTKEIFLMDNYRSCQNILDLSYKFIQQNNPERLEVKLVKLTSRTKGSKTQKFSKKLQAKIEGRANIQHFHFPTAEDEVKGVIKQIISLKNKDKEATWNDFAILARTNEAANYFVSVFSQTQIPFQFVASKGLYSKPIILDILAYLKLLDNYHESSAMYRILNLPIFGLEPRDLINLNYWAGRKSWSLYETLLHIAALNNIGLETREKINKVLGLIEKHTKLVQQKSTSAVILAFLEDSGYLKELTRQESLETQAATNYLNQFYRKVIEFENSVDDKSVKNFLELIELESEAGEEGSLLSLAEEGPEAIKIMTVHSAKGLEFKYVFIVNLVDKRFPTIERKDPIELPETLIKEIIPAGDIHLQEERRLFYVAMTRGKIGLFFTSASDYGGKLRKKLSRFLYELRELNFPLQTEVEIKERSLLKERTEEISAELSAEDLAIVLPAKFSFTQLKAFESCPYQYRFAHILRVPVLGKAQFSFGKTIHATLQQFFELVRQKAGVEQGELFGGKSVKVKKTALVSLEELLAIYQNCWLDDWYISRQQQLDYKEKGRKALREFYDKIKDDVPVPKYLERAFNLKISDGVEEYTLKGVIDRIDEVESGVEIIDYKTGSGKAGKNLESADKEQLLIYQIATQEVLGEKVKNLSYYYIEKNQKTYFLGEARDLENIKRKIIETIREIKKGKFPPKPGRLCQFCDFNRICESRAF